MNAAATAPAGSLTRWVLLVCTLVGLAAMHTIGHTGPDNGMHAAAASSTAAGTAETVPAIHAVVPCLDGHCDGHGAMDAFSVCMAVLQGLAVAVLLALLLLTVLGGLGRLRPWERAASGVPRAPPARRTGLTIAATSVLRI